MGCGNIRMFVTQNTKTHIMKKISRLFLLAAITMAGCTKKTTNNYVLPVYPLPAYVVNGVHDISVRNGGSGSFTTDAMLDISVQYTDSAQETVTLSLSSLPAGIVLLDTGWVRTGIPTFNTTLTFLDTTTAGATVGSYNMTLTAVGSTSGTKTYPFVLRVLPEQSCTQYLTGTYHNCVSGCSFATYTDSVYADPTVPNKIWFTNANGTGLHLYGMYSCSSDALTIPDQTIGTTVYSGTGSGFGTPSTKNLSFNLHSTSSTGINNCSVSMN